MAVCVLIKEEKKNQVSNNKNTLATSKFCLFVVVQCQQMESHLVNILNGHNLVLIAFSSISISLEAYTS